MSEAIAETKRDVIQPSKSFQFGVRQLLMYVFFVAMSFGLLKSPYSILSVFAKTFVIGALITAILLAIYRTGRLGAFWVGFAVVGSIYFYIAFLSDRFEMRSVPVTSVYSYGTFASTEALDEPTQILTHWILARAYPYLSGKQSVTSTPFPVPYGMPPPTTSYYAPPAVQVTEAPDVPAANAAPQSPTPYQPNTTPPQVIAPPPYQQYMIAQQPVYYQPVVSWPIFQSNGHSIFTILFAYIGGMFAQWLYLKRESKSMNG